MRKGDAQSAKRQISCHESSINNIVVFLLRSVAHGNSLNQNEAAINKELGLSQKRESTNWLQGAVG